MKGLYLAKVGNGVGVYAISLVNSPANGVQFTNPCKSGMCSVTKNNEVVGLVLRPGQVITRLNEDNSKWFFYFDKNTIKQAQESYVKNLGMTTSNLDHSDKNIEGVTFTESWLVENPERDKSIDYGFTPKEGEWYVKAKIENSEAIEALRNGDVRGWSLEGEFDFEPVQLKLSNELLINNNPMSKVDELKQTIQESAENPEVKATELEQEEVKAAMTPEEMEIAIGELYAKFDELYKQLNPEESPEPEEAPAEEEMAEHDEEEKPAEEEAEAEEKEEEMAEEKPSEIEELKAEIAQLKSGFAKLSDEIGQIPIGQETLREEVNLSSAKVDLSKMSAVEIRDLYNKK